MEIRYAQRLEGWYSSGSKARNFAGYIALVDAAEKLLVNQVEDADGVRRALGWQCWAARVTAQYRVKVLDASGAAAAQEAGP